MAHIHCTSACAEWFSPRLLGNIGSWEAIRLLGGALDDEDYDVSLNAAEGIADALGEEDLKPDREQCREHEASQKSRLKAEGGTALFRAIGFARRC